MGLSKPTVNRWKNGGGITDATAVIVADYFCISVEELMGRSDDAALVSSPSLDADLIQRLTSLTPEEQQKVDAFVQGLLASR